MAIGKWYKGAPLLRSDDPNEILKAVARQLLLEPKGYNQEQWGVAGKEEILSRFGERTEKDIPRCGTVCCVAGWVCQIKTGSFPDANGFESPTASPVLREAYDLLNKRGDLDRAIADTASLAYSKHNWIFRELFDGDALERQYTRETGEDAWYYDDDDNFVSRLPKEGTLEYAKLGVRHIERFMRTYLNYKGESLLALNGYAE